MRILRIIWFGIAFSTVIYAVIVFLLGNPPRFASFDESMRDPLILMLYGLGAVVFVIATVMYRAYRNRPPQLRMIVALALYESVAVYGVIAAFMRHDYRLYLAPWALALIGFIRVFPAAEQR
jgi:hypothetical protein